MKKPILILIMLMLFSVCAFAQKQIDQTFDASAVKNIDLFFKYPELVKIKVWDKNEVSIKGQVEIHNGEFDDDFELSSKVSGGKLMIESNIKNIDNYKNYQVYTDKDEDGESRAITISKNGTTITTGKSGRYTNGINISIVLEVTVPRNMAVVLDARYGLVEVLQSPKQLDVEARYGGVDVQVDETESLDLEASTQWGQIFSNLETKVEIGGDDGLGKWMKAHASIKDGSQRLKVESQYGHVYLRKN
ncbi:hypothetical protein [uncultured Roseivirga sp.]|uniref:hypothetical protein n=1 Tax=uncultured Roseivirga sp. TaxID=543088 RepID=UPI0030D711B1|tara:strand:- start:71268 stop:72008 length:741 start_codon:yes stop_codon:yes gene_type:complete